MKRGGPLSREYNRPYSVAYAARKRAARVAS